MFDGYYARKQPITAREIEAPLIEIAKDVHSGDFREDGGPGYLHMMWMARMLQAVVNPDIFRSDPGLAQGLAATIYGHDMTEFEAKKGTAEGVGVERIIATVEDPYWMRETKRALKLFDPYHSINDIESVQPSDAGVYILVNIVKRFDVAHNAQSVKPFVSLEKVEKRRDKDQRYIPYMSRAEEMLQASEYRDRFDHARFRRLASDAIQNLEAKVQYSGQLLLGNRN